MEQSKERTRNLAIAGLYVALMAGTASLRIPFPWVPLSLQSIFPLLAGNTLAPSLAAASQAAYLVLGLLGLPVFAHGGGIGYLIQPTFGYLLSFPIASFGIAALVRRLPPPVSFVRIFAIDLLGAAVILTIGVLWLFVFSNFILGKFLTPWKAIMVGAIVFVPGEAAKAFLATVIGRTILNRFSE